MDRRKADLTLTLTLIGEGVDRRTVVDAVEGSADLTRTKEPAAAATGRGYAGEVRVHHVLSVHS